ncbi:(4Fe-4S)-binding protein [Aureispira anguillae]|uniref:(4Fe-4S)-binding protein n=1 Tax=Aureispira anguillae TaxID=2864201 RepID=A0A916DV02_9BACT|nr:(4Fe-4S)-binding protein [Aureispira anguillae]BDS13212.1 (4Fe-4S)-binding protein [Aureispira anguillae]
MDKIIKKKYSNNEITIVWQPQKCIHAAECVKALPQVYKPNEKPWIQLEQATTEELKNQVRKCPSGALSYYMNGEEDQEEESLETKVEVLPNGPLLVYGTLKVTDQNGNTTTKNKTTAFCRCGSSANKPYCDGSHVKVDFRDSLE